LRLFSFYVGGKLEPDGTAAPLPAHLGESIRRLKGRDVVLELYLQGNRDRNTDNQAVAFVRETADLAAESGLTIVLYPHTAFYVETIGDAVRIAEKCDRENVGVMFNLCHFLRVEPESDLRATLEAASPLLRQVSVSGADAGGRRWSELIRTLDRGDYEVGRLVRILEEIGFDGPVGLQGYAVPGDPRDNLRRSIETWNELSGE
jgi:sugar phosphate isomerase/epimerase